MNPIRVVSQVEFELLRKRIDLEASQVQDHWCLLKGLDEARSEYGIEMNESNTFWHLTFIAHRDVVMAHLCRLYDKYEGALSLGRFLETVRLNRNLFSDSAFKDQTREVIDSDLDSELEEVSDSNPAVKTLRILRNSVVAHTDPNIVMGRALCVEHGSLREALIESLLKTAKGITSKYSLLFSSSTYGGIAGATDYKHLLNS